MKKFSKFFSLIVFGLLFVFALGLSGAKAANQTIDGDLTVNGNSWLNGGVNVSGDLHAAGNLLIFNHNLAGIDPEINFDRGDSRIKEMGDLFVYSDDYVHLGHTGATGAVLIQNASEISSKSQSGHSGVLMAGATTVTALSADSISLAGTQITATASELNILDGATLSTAELNYVDGVSSAIQGQLDSKMNTTGGNITNDLSIGGTLAVGGITTLSNATTVSGLFRANGDGTRSIISDSSDLVLEAGYATPKSLILISDEDTTDAINIDATAGGIDIDAVGEAGQDINILNTGGSLVLSATESAADAIDLNATAGGIDIRASGAAAGEDIDIIATGSSINITATEADAASIVLNASAGGVDITAATNDLDLVATAGDVTVQTGDDLNVTLGDDSTWTMAAGSQITVDAATADNTTTTGIINLDVDTITANNIGISLDYQVGDAAASSTYYGQKIDLTIDADAAQTPTVYGNYIGLTVNEDTAVTYGAAIIAEDAGTQVATAGLLIENLQATDIDMTDGIVIRATTADSIVDGIDVSDAEITNAINVGANILLGSTGAIDLTYFDVAATTGAVTLTRQAVGTSPFTITGLANSTVADMDINTSNSAGSIVDIDWPIAGVTQTAALSGIDIDFTYLTSVNGSTTYGLHINGLVAQTTSTEYAIYQEGTFWDLGLYIVDDAKFDGNVTLGTDPADSLSISASVATDISFSGSGGNRQITMLTAPTTGNALTISAGAAAAGANAGGNLAINAGDGTPDGSILIGSANTTAVVIGAATATVQIVSSSWNVSTVGVGLGFTGFTSTGTVDFSGATAVKIPTGTTDVGAACTTLGAIQIDTNAAAGSRLMWCSGTPGTWQQP